MKTLILLALLTAATVPAHAQFGGRRGGGYSFDPRDNVEYGEQFTFVRLRYDARFGGRGGSGWIHDYPRAERNFAKILAEVTLIKPYMGGSNVLSLDDPQLFNYPIAYMSEPGYWSMNEAEVEGLRNYLLKGGFLIFDDFGGWEFENFERQMQIAFPELQPTRLDGSHPIFNSFFKIANPEQHYSYRGFAEYYGYYEDNDTSKRLMVIANYNADIGEYWEFSDEGFLPIALSNEAYKLGVNYVIYAMTH
ncbi:MAG: DUF4159 domain-containing protein [Gemmatimonadetes bacterium]|nr:DUF4159 domain-containing protein [Gemmatimonadota bacterium]